MKFIIWIIGLFKKKAEPVKEQPPVVIISPGEPLPEIPKPDDSELAMIIVNESFKSELKSVCNIVRINWKEYKDTELATGVPADVVAACHYRESSLDFKGVLHNGEHIIGTGKKTKLMPKGRGPFLTWAEAAIDAMEIEKGKFPAKWDLAGKLDFCEKYNGLGYRNKGVPSPYVWAGTNKYRSGLYASDGVYNSSKIDRRLGCAAIIKGLA